MTCQAVATLADAGRIDLSSIEILFVGETDPQMIAAAGKAAEILLRHRSLIFQPRVSWQSAQEILGSSDVLLVFQGGHELQVPAKFFE